MASCLAVRRRPPGASRAPDYRNIPSVSAVEAVDSDGTWQLDTSLGSFANFSGSWVGYRVQDELAGVGDNTAVGRTPEVSGPLGVEGRLLTAATIEADLSTPVSDDDRRDDQLRRQALETDRFSTATFVLSDTCSMNRQPVADS